MRTSLAGAALVAAVALSACGGSGASGGGQTTQASQPAAATGTQTTSSQTTTATETQATTTAQGATTTAGQTGTASANSGGASITGHFSSDECTAADLSLSYLGGQGATGHGELGFALKNTGSETCHTGGYPGIQFLAKDGSPLATTPQHTTDDFFGHLPLQHVTLQPGQTASFRLGVSHGSGSNTGCTTADGLQVIAPNDTATMRVQIPNGASECGTTTVSPVQPGTSAFQ